MNLKNIIIIMLVCTFNNKAEKKVFLAKYIKKCNNQVDNTTVILKNFLFQLSILINRITTIFATAGTIITLHFFTSNSMVINFFMHIGCI